MKKVQPPAQGDVLALRWFGDAVVTRVQMNLKTRELEVFAFARDQDEDLVLSVPYAAARIKPKQEIQK